MRPVLFVDVVYALIHLSNPPYRPKVPSNLIPAPMYALMVECWAELPTDRPTFKIMPSKLANMPSSGAGDTSYLDYVLDKMEIYSLELENRVAEATSDLTEEKSRSEELLAQMLPK